MEITPFTRLGALLEAHPELQEDLIAFAPPFAKLRNPVLRATVAKVATLEQVAKVGGVPLPELIAFLQGKLGGCAAASETAPAAAMAEAWPAWFKPEAVAETFDATPLLATGTHPLALVRKAVTSRPPGAIVLLLSDFEPAPLIAQFTQEGLLVACVREAGRYHTAVRRT